MKIKLSIYLCTCHSMSTKVVSEVFQRQRCLNNDVWTDPRPHFRWTTGIQQGTQDRLIPDNPLNTITKSVGKCLQHWTHYLHEQATMKWFLFTSSCHAASPVKGSPDGRIAMHFNCHCQMSYTFHIFSINNNNKGKYLKKVCLYLYIKYTWMILKVNFIFIHLLTERLTFSQNNINVPNRGVKWSKESVKKPYVIVFYAKDVLEMVLIYIIANWP